MKASVAILFSLLLLACSKPNSIPDQGGDGRDCANAIHVKSVEEEYVWMKSHYPGFRPMSQSLLMKCNGKDQATDMVVISLPDGTTKTLYFTGFSLDL